jgi:methyl-accepting chemotaxis protein
MKPWIPFGLRTAAVASVLAAAKFESLVLGLLPVAVICLYAILVWKVNRNDPSKIDTLADQVYFLGYLSTLAALAGVVLMIRTGKGLDDPKKLLLMVAISLLATVAGLLAMMSLKDVASNLRETSGASDFQWEDQIVKALKGMSPSSVGVPVEVTQELVNASNKIATLVSGVNNELETLRTKIAILGDRVNEGAAGAKQFSDAVLQLKQVLNDFVQLVRELFPETKEQAEKL